MRKLMLILLTASLLSISGRAFAGDTGTYRILSYKVGLTPHSDGTVAIDYYQRWLVTGGHIPWITAGTPNGNFTITGSGGAASMAESASESDWSGVRLDLDRDYRSGETFEASFSIVQRGLFFAEEQNYKLDFTPGWYGRAVTDTLRVSVKFFASLDSVTADPQPSFVSGDEMVWNKYGLGQGEHFSIHVSFPVGLFPAGIAASNLKNASGGRGSGGAGAIVFIIIIVVIIIMVLNFNKRRYSGGRIFYGGIPGGRPGGGRSGSGRSSSGGGGFGGASMSCACACVSCACACACAGGGGAGCSRKLEHTCPVCGEKEGIMKRIVPCLLCVLALVAACGGKSDRYDRNVSVPKGDPAFPPLAATWVIDAAGALSDSVIIAGDAICQRLKTDDVAEVVVVLMDGVKQPENWATHYGRWLGLGKKGLSTEGGNRGLVWLIRPDAEEKLTVSVGRGLPGFTTVDYGPIMDEAIEYLNFHNYDKGVMTLIIRTDQVLRTIQSGGK